MQVKTNLEPTTDFVPSTQWQDVPDGIAVPPGGEYKINPNTGLRQARWDNPPPPDQVKKVTPRDQQAAATPDHEAEPEPEQILEGIYALLGRVVLLPIPLGTKGPDYDAWQRTTYEDTQRPDYRRNLINTISRGGNLGVLEGPASGRLLARDVDDDQYVEKLLADHPWLASTTRTRGKRGCQFFLRLEEECDYPNGQAVVNIEHGELRLGGGGKGAQSVIWGVHPDGMRYQILKAVPPLEISLADLDELCPALWRATGEGGGNGSQAPQPEPTRAGEAKLAAEELAAQRLEGEAQSVAQTIDAFYDVVRKEYALREGTPIYQSVNEAQFKRVLRTRGLSSERLPNRQISQLDIVLDTLRQTKFVQYVGSLAGRDAGYYLENGILLLVTSSPAIFSPKPGTWETIKALFKNLLWGEGEPWGKEQETVFYGWLLVAFNALRVRKFQPGQALAFAGPVDAGKSLTQKLITLILGGRSAKAAMFLQGRTDFNSELFGAEHLYLEDENVSTSHTARMALAAAIKNIVANQQQPCHAKGRDIVNLSPWWRVTISLNDRSDRMLVLPPLEHDDIAGKIILLRATAHDMPMPTETIEQKAEFWQTLTQELPSFLHWLITDFEIPSGWRNPRFGVKAWHNPALLTELEELSPAIALLELIDRGDVWTKQIWGSSGQLQSIRTIPWKGTALQLRACLLGNHATRHDAQQLLNWTNATGQYLNDLACIRPGRVKALRTHSTREYEIYP
jgi:hypothetical protein